MHSEFYYNMGLHWGSLFSKPPERLRAESSGLALCNRGALGLRIGFLYKDYNRSFKRASIRVATVPLNVLL